MKKTILLGILISVNCISYKALGQAKENLGAWYIYNGFFNFSPKVEVFFETQFRTYEPISNIQVFFVRPYLNYNFNKNFQVGLGQEYHSSWTYDEIKENKVRSEEYRTTIQAMLFQKLSRLAIQHRYRYEFRFLDEAGNQRMRYRLQLGIPLSQTEIVKGTMFTTIGNELMVDTQKELKLSQYRLYAMFGYQLAKGLNFQFGYMNILFPSQPSHHRLQFFITQKLFFYEN